MVKRLDPRPPGVATSWYSHGATKVGRSHAGSLSLIRAGRSLSMLTIRIPTVRQTICWCSKSNKQKSTRRKVAMKPIQTNGSIHPGSPADRRILVDGLTLIALGLSILFLNQWDGLFVRTAIGLFWGTFFLISNWSGLVQTTRALRQKNDRQRRSSYRSST